LWQTVAEDISENCQKKTTDQSGHPGSNSIVGLIKRHCKNNNETPVLVLNIFIPWPKARRQKCMHNLKKKSKLLKSL
jgi:hypothetical protein